MSGAAVQVLHREDLLFLHADPFVVFVSVIYFHFPCCLFQLEVITCVMEGLLDFFSQVINS